MNRPLDSCTRRVSVGFTLVELLVVVTILGVLVAMLIPALSQSKLQALRLKQSNNMRQLQMGFLQYAEDNKATLPSRTLPWYDAFFGANRFYVSSGMHAIDLRKVVIQYGTMAATANPVLGTPALDNPGNSDPNSLCWNFSWFPGNGLLNAANSPTKIAAATPEMAMMMDGLQADPTVTTYYATNCPRVLPVQVYSNNVSAQFCLTTSAAEIAGAYAGRYDGSVRWYQYREIQWKTYSNGWKNSYLPP